MLTRPGAASRRGEVASTAHALDALGLRTASIAPPGTLDGGDVLKVGRTVDVGRGARTNADGVEQLATLLAPRGWSVVPVPVAKVLHLKSAVTALPDRTVLGFAPTPHPAPLPAVADDPRASSSSRCQGRLDTASVQPAPVASTQGTSSPITPSTTSRAWTCAAWPL